VPDIEYVSFLSDYGRADEFVAVCHAVMLELAPHLRVLDVTHEIPPFDVRSGSMTLVRAIQYLPSGIVLAVVDPGVGTDRRCLAVEVEQGFLVGPDNGLLAPAVAMLGGPGRVVALTNPDYQLATPGVTFAGRDIMASAAGHLAAGVPATELGEEVDAAGLAPGLLPLFSEEDEGHLAGEVLWVDRFGNCQLNVGPDDLAARGMSPGDAVEVRLAVETRRARWVRTYAEAKPSELVVLVDSYGLLALAFDRQSAASLLQLRPGGKVTLVLPGAPDALGAQEAPVRLGRTEER